MSIRDIFKPKPDRFVQLLHEQASLTAQGLKLLQAYFKEHSAETAAEIHSLFKESEEVRRILIEELMRTFVTPFDREDIFSFSRSIQDVLEYASTTVDEMQIFEVNSTSFMQRMADLLAEAAAEILLAVERLQDNHLAVASDHAERAKALENQVEAVYRKALADLFKSARDVEHIVLMLKAREIYRHLSNAADREDQAANVLAEIVMKMT